MRCDSRGRSRVCFDWTLEQFGRLGIAFNNAGISGEDLFADEQGRWAGIIDIDLTAVIDPTRLAVKKMKKAGTLARSSTLRR